MSIPAYKVAWKQNLPPHLKIVLLAIADFASESGLAFPSYDTIAAMCGIKRRQAIKSVDALVEAGIVKKEKRLKHDRLQTSNYYTIQGVTQTPIRPAW